jgi:DNA repair protein RadC
MTHTPAAALPAESRYSPSNAPQLFVRDSDGNYLAAPDDRVIDAARQVVERSVSKGMKLTTPNRVREFLWLKLAGYDHEVFGAIFLDTQHRVIEFSELFHGTLDSASVYPREVVKAALHHNAGAVIFVHYVPWNIMYIMCPVFLCALSTERWRTARRRVRTWTTA